MRVTKRQVLDLGRTPDLEVTPPKPLAKFLNFDPAKTELRVNEKEIGFWWPLTAFHVDREAAKRIQKELREILIPLTHTKQRPKIAEAHSLIAKITAKANGLKVDTKWEAQCIEYDVDTGARLAPDELYDRHIDAGENAVEISVVTPSGRTAKARWRISRKWETSSDTEERVYWDLIGAFRSREFSLLKSCPQCQNFFVADDPRRDFCSDECRNTYNNKQRLGEGYFKELRRKKRTLELKTAKRLLAEGKSLKQVVEKTGLSERVLKRERIL